MTFCKTLKTESAFCFKHTTYSTSVKMVQIISLNSVDNLVSQEISCLVYLFYY